MPGLVHYRGGRRLDDHGSINLSPNIFGNTNWKSGFGSVLEKTDHFADFDQGGGLQLGVQITHFPFRDSFVTMKVVERLLIVGILAPCLLGKFSDIG